MSDQHSDRTGTPPSPAVRRSTGLTGIRVVELGEMVSAPYAAKLLADLGADVIKVEPPSGDPARQRGPFPASAQSPNHSGLYLALNTNKRSVVVDPEARPESEEGGHGRLAPLVNSADILITNYGPETLADLGIDLVGLHRQRPELVICSITPFGLSGPHAGYQAVELTTSHAGGWAYQAPGSSSEPDQPPLKVSGHQTDFHAGMAGAMATLATFDRAEQTGVGDLIDFCSIAHTAGLLEGALIAASYMGVDPNRLGSRLLNPWGIYPCVDGLIFLVAVEQDQWERLVELMGQPDWTTLGLFDTLELRHENADLLDVYLEEWTKQHTVEDLWVRGQAARICFAPVLSMADMAGQAHLAERGFFVDVEHDHAGTVTHLGPSFTSTSDSWGPLHSAPTLDPYATLTFGPRRTPSTAPTKPSEPRTSPAGSPLDGLRVLDLSWVWAGPYGAMHLAFLGADVIKVESSARPGLGRRLALHPPEMEPTLNTSAYFNQWEQGKLSVELDLSRSDSIAVIKRLVAECDIVIENFATGVMERLGLGYDELKAIKPDIIVASISGYGSTGPLREYMGYGPTTGPLSGLSSLTGYLDGPPCELGISIGDPGAGITAAFAICAAIVERRATGDGCYIDVALWEATASNAIEGWMAHALGHPAPSRIGNRDPQMAPHGCYRTTRSHPNGLTDIDPADDGLPDPGAWISIACRHDAEWQTLAALIDSELMTDRRFETLVDRKANEDELDAIIDAWTITQDRWTLTGRLQSAGLAAFPSMSPQDLLAYRHLWDRGFFETLPHPEVGVRTHAGLPWRSAVGPHGVTRPAPLLGQHTEEVLSQLLGLSAEEIAALR